MSEPQTITINGRVYDAKTGQAINKGAVTTHAHTTHTQHHSTEVHNSTQRSQTLNRHATKKPELRVRVTPAPVAAPKQRNIVAQSPAITKFAPHPRPMPTNSRSGKLMSDIAPVKHTTVERAHAMNAQKKAIAHNATQQQSTTRQTPSQVIKQAALDEALAKAPTKKQQAAANKKKSFLSRHPRVFSIASATLALAMLGGYLTYLNVPSLSVRVAAAQAGIAATYPEYKPDGYSLNGPIATKEGSVAITFASNSGPQNFVVTQTKSSWDSSAVVDNLVKPKSDDNYITTNERGLTIYTYSGNAAWVNGGILYTIEGDAPLSGEQIRRIATSL